MPRILIRLLVALATLALVGGACSSFDGDDAADDADQSEVDDTSGEDAADDEPTDDEVEDDADDEGRADAIDLIEQLGFSNEGAACIVDSLEDNGVDLADLDFADAADPSGELADAMAQAGAACAEEIGDDLPAGATDLSNPQVYDAFVQGFSTTSGLSIEVSRCVADYLIEHDINPGELAGSDAQSAVADAVNECQ